MGYLKPEEVAKIFRISKVTVYRLLKEGKLPKVIVKGQYRIPQNALFKKLLSKDGKPHNLLTIKEVAFMFKVSPKTIRRMISEGRIPVIVIGRQYRIPKSALKQILKH